VTCPACDEPLTGMDPPVCLMCGWSRGMVVPPKKPSPRRNGRPMNQSKDEIPSCKFCDSSMKPERIGAGRYVCNVCSRITIIPK